MSAPSDYQPFRAIIWMTFSGLLFVGVTALFKYLGTGVPAAEAAFLRYALGLVLLLPMIPEFRRSWKRGAITKPLMWVFVGRGAAHSCAFYWCDIVVFCYGANTDRRCNCHELFDTSVRDVWRSGVFARKTGP